MSVVCLSEMVTFSEKCFPAPSNTSPFWTFTSKFGTSIILMALFGDAKMASDKSNPTFVSATSNAATNSISPGSYPPILYEVSPM